MLKRIGSWVAAALVIATASVGALAADTATARFDNLKAVAGDWTMTGGDGSVAVTYRVTAGNQPHMKAVKSGEANTIEFKYDGGGNIKSSKEGHMHEATFAFIDADHVKSTWLYYEDGKAGDTKVFSLVRLKS